MVNGAREALLLPSLAAMTISPDVPTSPAVGVPVNAPVVVLKLAQAGWPVIEKVTVPVLAADTVGLKEYALPAVTLAAGVPAMLSAVAGGVGDGVLVGDDVVG
jgi:hypothetical protein